MEIDLSKKHQVEHFYYEIDGWATIEDQGNLLTQVLDNIDTSKKINIAEIGVYKGRGTAIWNVELLNKCIDYNYFAIDHFKGSIEHDNNVNYYEITKTNLKPIQKYVNIIKNDSLIESKKYDNEFFDIIYIDASHDYDSVKKDILTWLPKLKYGGVICGDDYIEGWEGVIRAVNDIFGSYVNKFGHQQWWVKKQKPKVALVCIAKDEDKYIKEWVDYHKKLNFDDIYVFQNDWRWKGEKIDAELKVYDGFGKQIECYNHFIDNYQENYDWVAFFDVDEFLVLKKHKNIQDFVEDYFEYDSIGINWVLFGDNGIKYNYDNHKLVERFLKRQEFVNPHIKSIVKLRPNIFMTGPHNANVDWVATDKTLHNGPFNIGGDDNIAQLNHYFCKTKDEFNIKINRGRADGVTINRNIYEYENHNFNEKYDYSAYNFYTKGNMTDIEKPIKKYFNDDYHKHIFVVDSWPDTVKKEKTLIDCINRLKEFDIEILLVGHYPIKPEIQSIVDYYIYDKNNPILLLDEFENYDVSSGRWTQTDDYYVENKHDFHHDYAIWETMRNAFNFCKYLGKEYIHFMEYDNVIDTFQFKQAFIEESVRNDVVIYEYNENSKDLELSPYMATFIFSIRTDIALKTIDQIKSRHDYFYNRPGGWQLERVFLNSIRNVTNSIFLTKYIANDNELNKHAVWNRDGMDMNGAKFQVYPCVHLNGKLYLHLISGFYSENANDDYLIEFRYHNINKFITLRKNTYELIELGEYQKGGRVKIFFNGVMVLNEFLNKPFDEYYKKNKVTFSSDKSNITVNTNFIDGAFAEVLTDKISNYFIEFIDSKNNNVIYSTSVGKNSWARPNQKYFIDWLIRIKEGKQVIYERKLDYTDSRVFISFESKSLGDNLAWIPIVEQFRVKHNCRVVCSTFWNKLFKDVYPEIEFVEPGETVYNLVAQYKIGLFYINGELDTSRHFNDIKKEPLQKIASDILGLDFIEERPKVLQTKPSELKNRKYVCIAPHATALAKYWNKPNGWQEVVNYLNSNGYEVVYISSESMNDEWHNSKIGGRLKKVVNKSGDRPIENRISDLRGASAFIGVSSGLSWLSWACGTPTVLISGFTDKHLEFQDCHRIINKSVCHGCWHEHKLDPGNWRWCPLHEKTEREFECTKTITAEEVIESLKKIL